jgi:hypothetical protein
MDKETRNRIERTTQSAQALLEHDLADRLAGVFDIRLDGTPAAHCLKTSAPSDHQASSAGRSGAVWSR